jgi:hypothetical protein
MRRGWTIGAALVALAGCGGREEANQAAAGQGQPPANVVVSAPEGRAEVRTGGAAAAMPGGLPAYPGASGTGSVDVTGAAAEGSGHIVGFTTPDPPSQVIAFYAQAATGAGYRIAQQMNMGPTAALTAVRAEGEAVSVTATQAGGTTQVQVVVGQRR